MQDTSTTDLGDAVSALTVIATFSELLPPIAAVLAIIWTSIRMYEWFRFRVLGYGEREQFK